MPDGEAKLKALREFAVECAILKVKASENATTVIDETLQIHGGIGYSVETGIEMGVRDVRITRIYEGTNEINRMLSVAELSKRHLKTKEINLTIAGKKIPKMIVAKALPFSSDNELDFVENIKAVFLLLSGATGKKLGKKLIDEQEIVMNLADILAEAYLTESAFLRVARLRKLKTTDEATVNMMEKAAKIYLYDALENVRKAGNEIIDAYATGWNKGLMRYLLSLFTKRYEINAKELRRELAQFAYSKKDIRFKCFI
ncbi:MAG: DUF1974 domain-containing protein [Chitinophagales bacterium]|nr:DUF1974 domain-containing protein [Chitinophagales bacterium]